MLISPLLALLPRFTSHLATLAATGSLVLLAASGLAADASPPPAHPPVVRLARDPFDAPAAWAEFAELLRLNYAYLTRPGIDGEAILAYFEPQAKAAASKEAFREVLQLVAHNFADPHFIVGPLDLQDYNVVPTSSDLCARYRAPHFEVVDVRRDSNAQAQGIVPGAEIISINGQTPQAAVETVMGRPLASLTAPQLDAGITIALAGLPRQARQLTLAVGSEHRTYTLRSLGERSV
jgi:hypothetical protein